jgi:hypothetical protein
MKQVKHLGITVFIFISLFLIFSETAWASTGVRTFDHTAYAYYIDAGTGSIIIQVLIGSFVGGIALIGIYRTRVKDFLTNLFTGRRQDKEIDENRESEKGE